MEKAFQIPTDDDHLIYGIINSESTNKKAIVFVHGLTGYMHEHPFFNASRFFPKKGFATVRFDLYTGEKSGRNLRETTMDQHASDLETVIAHVKKMFEEVFVVGHSLGGPVILMASQKDVSKVVLWDPTHTHFADSEFVTYDEGIQAFLLRWGVEYVLSAETVNSWRVINETLIKKITKPTKIICGGKGILFKLWEKSLEKYTDRYTLEIISDAGHGFDEGDTEQTLFAKTLAWFEKS